MLIEYIGKYDLIRCNVDATDWIQVIQEGCRLLEQEGFITSEYAPSIIKMTQEHGPYYVLTPGVAMPHSRPEAGVVKKGISVMTLSNPVSFGSEDNDPVSIVITLAATDNKSHLGLMEDIVMLLSDDSKLKRLGEAECIETIKSILSEVE